MTLTFGRPWGKHAPLPKDELFALNSLEQKKNKLQSKVDSAFYSGYDKVFLDISFKL